MTATDKRPVPKGRPMMRHRLDAWVVTLDGEPVATRTTRLAAERLAEDLADHHDIGHHDYDRLDVHYRTQPPAEPTDTVKRINQLLDRMRQLENTT